MLSRLQIEARIAEARAARDAGIAQAEAADRSGWDTSLIDQAIGWFAQGVHPFSANDLRELLPPDVRQPLIGARFSRWQSDGLILRCGVETSTKPNTHCKTVGRWMGCLENTRPSSSAPMWVREAITDYRAARDAWDALRESAKPAPASVAGTNGATVALHQLEDADFVAAHPPPAFRDFLADRARRQRREEQPDHECIDEVDVDPPSQRCGRIDDHPVHDWTCGVCKVTYRCSGHVVIEGGAR